MTARWGISLLLVGDELLDGRVHDTNSHWLSDRITDAGRRVRGVEVVGDRVEDIAEALRRAVARSGAVVVSGGLGPTPDDLTREALAAVAGEELVLDEEALGALRRRFESRGRRMAPTNRQQALRPVSAEMIENPVGTAPALWQVVDGVPVVLLPGVPAELRALWEQEVGARVVARVDTEPAFAIRLRTTQIAESTLAERVRSIDSDAAAEITYCVAEHGVDLLLRGSDPDRIETVARELEEGLAPHVFARGTRSLAEVVVGSLLERRRTVAVAESCTGGLLGGALTAVPGSSGCFLGGVLAYADEVKQRELSVAPELLAAHGAVSEEVAAAMAEGARRRFSCDWALSTTGIAGPGGGTPEKPVGTVWVALAGEGKVEPRQLRLGGERALVRRWTVAAALDLLRRATASAET